MPEVEHAQSGRATMGPLEREIYRRARQQGNYFRDRARLREVAVEHLLQGPSRLGGFGALRRLQDVENLGNDGEDDETPSPLSAAQSAASPPNPIRIAVSLLLARAIDGHASLRSDLNAKAPIVTIDVVDGAMMDIVETTWRSVLFEPNRRLVNLAKDPIPSRDRMDALYLCLTEPLNASVKSTRERAILSVLPFALPLVAISPSCASYLPEFLNAAATHRIVMPKLDRTVILAAIRLVTGRPCRKLQLDANAVSRIALFDLAVAIRFDRTPQECLTELERLATGRNASRSSREIALVDLHGMPAARRWADDALADLAAWRRGEVSWDATASSAILVGPPGTGKTLFCEAFAREVGPLIACSYARWQSDGEGHLGHTLRAMRRDFESARAQAPSVLFIDEIDSFPDRGSVTHSHRDYSRSVVNALLEEIEGVRKREGVFVLGCTNSLGICDPALIRAGRLETIIRVGLPDLSDLERIMRVKLRGELKDEPLSQLAELAIGMSGADVEKFVDDARRLARNEGRALTSLDIRRVIVDDDVPEHVRWRTAVHEAGHILMEVLFFGPNDVFASLAANRERLGISVRTKIDSFEGSARQYRARIAILMAGRVAEELILAEPTHGSSSDLEEATSLVCAMHGSFGLAGSHPLIYLGPSNRSLEFLRFSEVREAVGLKLAEAERDCRTRLEVHRVGLLAVARQLFDCGRIDGHEVERLIRAAGDPRSVDTTVDRSVHEIDP